VNSVIILNKGNFEQEVLQSPVPVLVDFWAAWCGPCMMIRPLIEQLAEEYGGKVKIGKVNVDEEGDLAGQYGVVSLPTLLVYKDGAVVNKKCGAVPRHDIEALFKNYI